MNLAPGIGFEPMISMFLEPLLVLSCTAFFDFEGYKFETRLFLVCDHEFAHQASCTISLNLSLSLSPFGEGRVGLWSYIVRDNWCQRPTLFHTYLP
jgi:hypothetical protein